MNNILFFLMPKAMCAYLYDDYSLRQALEKMEAAGYAALPILTRKGEISRRKDNIPVRVTTSMYDLVDRASTQNFVPVVDDKGAFIGIVTRSSIIKYCKQQLFPED